MWQADSSRELALNSAAGIAEWVARELGTGTANDHLCRVITRETDRWFKNGLSADEISNLVATPGTTGDPRWDALFQGVVAYRMRAAKIPLPPWVSKARLESAWAPYGDTIRDDGWYALSVLHTPAALLDRGVVFDRNNLELV